MWNEGQIKSFARTLKENWEPHWHIMPEAFRSAVVDQFVLGVVTTQDSEMVSVKAVETLRDALWAKMGI